MKRTHRNNSEWKWKMEKCPSFQKKLDNFRRKETKSPSNHTRDFIIIRHGFILPYFKTFFLLFK